MEKEFFRFSELSKSAQNRAIKKDKHFSTRFGFAPASKKELGQNVYRKDGSVSCMTIEQGIDWGYLEEKEA